MNALFEHALHAIPATTQAAEGLPRRRFTVSEIDALCEAGFFGEHEHFELIGGEIVPMNAKGIFHETLKQQINQFLGARCPKTLRFVPETTYRLAPDTFLEPDFLIYPAEVKLRDLNGSCGLLVIEVADSSLSYDLETKARLYAGFGIAEYWVIEARRCLTHIHRDNDGSAYRTLLVEDETALLAPLAASELAFRLADFDLER